MLQYNSGPMQWDLIQSVAHDFDKTVTEAEKIGKKVGDISFWWVNAYDTKKLCTFSLANQRLRRNRIDFCKNSGAVCIKEQDDLLNLKVYFGIKSSGQKIGG